MTAASERRLSLGEFLSYDHGIDRRYELVNGVLVKMGDRNVKTPAFSISLV